MDLNNVILMEAEIESSSEAATTFMEMQRRSFPQPQMDNLEAEVAVSKYLAADPPQGAAVGPPGGLRLSVKPCEAHDIAFIRN